MRVRNVMLSILAALSGPAVARDAAEVLPSGVILEAGQVDSSKVRVGAPVAVVYGLGYRNPVSGEWLKLTTARGTVQAVDGQRLLLALEESGQSQRIDLARIQTLVLTGSPSSGSTDRDSIVADGSQQEPFGPVADSARVEFQAVPQTVQDDSWQARNGEVDRHLTKDRHVSLPVEDPVIRIAKKLGAGALWGTFGVLVGFSVGEISNPEPDPFAAVAAGHHIVLLGYTFGSPIGVSWFDSRDRGVLTWAGSLAGWSVGRMALERGPPWSRWSYCAPLIGATIASELWRRSPQDGQDSHVSVNLGPASNGGFGTVATLRF